MDYRSLLSKLRELFHDQDFDSAYTALMLDIPPKTASNDLGRLYKMGFLARRRVKRDCLLPNGKSCNKGYEYYYRFSNQGLSYLHWLTSEKSLEDSMFKKTYSGAASNLPEDQRGIALSHEAMRASLRYRGPGSDRTIRLMDLIILDQLRGQVQTVQKDNLDFAVELFRSLLENKRLSSDKNCLEEINQIYIASNRALKEETQRLRLEVDRIFAETTKSLSKEIDDNLSIGLIWGRLIEFYQRRVSNLLTILCLVTNPEAVKELVDLACSLDKTYIESIKHDLEELKLQIVREYDKNENRSSGE